MPTSAVSCTPDYFNPLLTLIRESSGLNEKNIRREVITPSTKNVPACLRDLSINCPLKELLSAQGVRHWVRLVRQSDGVQCCFYALGQRVLERQFNVSSKALKTEMSSVMLSTISSAVVTPTLHKPAPKTPLRLTVQSDQPRTFFWGSQQTPNSCVLLAPWIGMVLFSFRDRREQARAIRSPTS